MRPLRLATRHHVCECVYSILIQLKSYIRKFVIAKRVSKLSTTSRVPGIVIFFN